MRSKGCARRCALTKAASRLKFSSTFLNGRRINAEPLCGAAFLLELWNNAARCSLRSFLAQRKAAEGLIGITLMARTKVLHSKASPCTEEAYMRKLFGLYYQLNSNTPEYNKTIIDNTILARVQFCALANLRITGSSASIPRPRIHAETEPRPSPRRPSSRSVP